MSIFIKILIGLFFIGFGYICIKFGDKQFGEYNFFSKLFFKRFFPDKIVKFEDKLYGWIFGIIFIGVGILIIFAYIGSPN